MYWVRQLAIFLNNNPVPWYVRELRVRENFVFEVFKVKNAITVQIAVYYALKLEVMGMEIGEVS